ncbi:MAG: hypothetical protein AAF581_10165 [Planctomycetota bacterium]
MSSLVQTAISSAFFEELPKDSKLPATLREQLRSEVESPAQLKALKKAAKAATPYLEPDLAGFLHEEVAEIGRDLEWVSSSRGKYIATVNDWHQEFQEEYRGIDDFDRALIGCHAQLQVVFLAGKVRNQAVLDRLLEYVRSKNPPYKIHHKIEIADVA